VSEAVRRAKSERETILSDLGWTSKVVGSHASPRVHPQAATKASVTLPAGMAQRDTCRFFR
jgi:hypothetical protein